MSSDILDHPPLLTKCPNFNIKQELKAEQYSFADTAMQTEDQKTTETHIESRESHIRDVDKPSNDTTPIRPPGITRPRLTPSKITPFNIGEEEKRA
jgi:hypothetical protein